MILVSACLWGERSRYDGRHSQALWLREALAGRDVLALCPEQLGGLPTPRPPARIVGARAGREGDDVLAGRAKLIDAHGRDVSRQFIAGARAVLARAQAAGARRAYLKDRSPSCGHDPLGQNPQGGPGQGVLTALLLAGGFEVVEVRAAAGDD
ncbi:protein of unknown function DUF523 [Desulfarculus baarsii DSM 2075]|uniref:Uncharacterized protein n=1 Tax=Desulfarculus baarsii (strain ATCC 33931 / DSM 2075 / LMG 7858 / VKM B-1802 / 2st14) TaxID=644282 RepID=E1QG06_DESB2|nr:2-thiouracil desulfurase family protein [Desulfarculus baarsii]ADK84616.1 protein of unknown function DUF523 [Desulfarculus baarsii DSM 2075]